MKKTHEQEKKQFKRLFQQQGINQFGSRFRVLEAFLKLEKHVTIRDIQNQLRSDKIYLEVEFIQNSMELLCRFGFATEIEFEHKETQFEHRHLGLHHDHMVCTKCGSILEFKDEAIEHLQYKVAEAYGFHLLQHKMELYGICSKCKELRSGLVTLSMAKPGEKMIIKEFEAGRNVQLRISSMGLKIGDLVEIVSAGFGGQVVIASGENRLVLGKGMAEKIKVKPFDSHKPEFQISSGKKDEARSLSIPLSQMKTGQRGIIKKVTGESVLRRRLLEMGINRGSEIYVEKYAPLKDPLELVVKGYHVSLRVGEAANIMIENVSYKNN